MQLLQRDAVVLEEEEAVVADGDFDLLDEIVDDGGVVGVQEREVDGLECCEAFCLVGDWGTVPFWHGGFAGEGG